MSQLLRPGAEATSVASGEPRPRANTAWGFGIAAALLAVHAMFAWTMRHPNVLESDEAVYFLLARSLRSFEYRDVFLLDAPIHQKYPPVYPAALAVWGALVGERYAALVVLNIVASVLALGLVFDALRRTFSTRIALLVLAALCVNPWLVRLAGTLLSESFYLFWSALALWLLALEKQGARVRVAVGGAALVTALTRSVGLAMLAGVTVHWLLQRRIRAVLALMLAAGSTVGAWNAWSVLAPAKEWTNSYVVQGLPADEPGARSFALELVSRVTENTAAYLKVEVPTILGIPVLPTPVDTLVLVLVLAVGCVALASRWRPAVLYLVAYAGILAVWPWPITRLGVPLLPFLVPVVLLGTRSLFERVRSGWGMPAIHAAAAILVLAGVAGTRALPRHPAACQWDDPESVRACVSRVRDPGQASYLAAAVYARRSLPRDAVLLGADAPPLHYYSGRATILILPVLEVPASVFVSHLRRSGATHVLLGRAGPRNRNLLPLLRATCSDLDVEADFPPSTLLLRLRAPGAAPSRGEACEALEAVRAARR